MELTFETYVPNARQQVFHRSPAKYRLLMGAWGSAKTTMLIAEDIQLALEHPGSVGVVFRKTYPALRDTTQRAYLSMIPRQLIKSVRRSEGREQVEFTNGAVTMFRCLDDPLKLGSTQYDRVSIDETGEVDEYPFRTLAFGRLRGPLGPRRMVVATNPVDRTHWLYDFFVTKASDDTAVFHYGTRDNYRTCSGWIIPGETHLLAEAEEPGAVPCPDGPAQSHTHVNVPADYLARLEQMTPHEQKKFLYGHWGVVAQGASFFPMFDEELHVGEFRVIPHRLVHIGWDPGFACPAAGWWQQDTMGAWVKLHELVGSNEAAPSFIQRVLAETGKKFPTNPIHHYCDVAGSQRHDTGPSFTDLGRKKFDITFRFRRMGLMRSLLKMQTMFGTLGSGGRPLARIDARCDLSVAAYAGNYYVDPRSPDGEPKKPNHPYDDLVDADRYALAPVLMDLSPPTESPRQRPLWRVA